MAVPPELSVEDAVACDLLSGPHGPCVLSDTVSGPAFEADRDLRAQRDQRGDAISDCLQPGGAHDTDDANPDGF